MISYYYYYYYYYYYDDDDGNDDGDDAAYRVPDVSHAGVRRPQQEDYYYHYYYYYYYYHYDDDDDDGDNDDDGNDDGDDAAYRVPDVSHAGVGGPLQEEPLGQNDQLGPVADHAQAGLVRVQQLTHPLPDTHTGLGTSYTHKARDTHTRHVIHTQGT